MARNEDAVRRGNVVYDLDSFQSGVPLVPLYVSNGIVGGCLDHFGFMSRPNTGTPEGRTALGYVDHYYRADHGRHIQFPLAVIQARFGDGLSLGMVDCRDYRQELDIHDGLLRTSYDLYGKTEITTLASQTAPNLFAMAIARASGAEGRSLAITIECETSRCQNNDSNSRVAPVELSFAPAGDRVRVVSRTNTTETRWTIACRGARIEVSGTTVLVSDLPSKTDLRLWVSREGCAGEEILDQPFDWILGAHVDTWHELWATSWVDLPEDRAQRIWCRMKYYLLSTFPPVPARAPCPTGLLSNIWGFTFPQDVYYMAENLSRLGHGERSEVSLAWWREHLDDACAYGKRLLGTQGAYYPWTPPYKDWDTYETDGITGADSYELHNPAYVAAMVWHHYIRTGDKESLNRYFPIVEQVFAFYRGISTKSPAGTYDTYHEKARGQDEASSVDGKLRNLLCVSYSAEYSARIYREAAAVLGRADFELLAVARDIVDRGYTREALLRPDGFYATYEGDTRPVGSQKHPVQLNPIAYLPMPDMAESDPAVAAAWRNRFELTVDARKPLTLGWTLGEFALASARMRAPDEMERDLRAVQPCRGADPRWIQFYESSFWEGWHLMKAYYFPMMALYLQAFTDCLVQDWRGYIDLFACLLPGWEKKRLAFAGVRTIGGVEVSGKWSRGFCSVRLIPHGAARALVRVSAPGMRLQATGQASGPAAFASGQTVELTFAKRHAIVIDGETR